MYDCEYCTRKFAGKRALKNHQSTCARSSGGPDTTPSIEELWKIVQSLVKKNEELEKKMKKILNKASKERSKIDIIVWLNENHRNALPFMEWRKQWQVTDEQMEYLLEHKYVAGVSNIIKENLADEEVMPMRAFKKRSNFMYIYDEHAWRKMTDKDFKSLLANTQAKIAGAFIRWQKANPKIVNNDKDGKYEKYMIEAFGGNKSKEATDKAIRKNLFDFVKLEMKSFQTYEFS
jgi:hypothetical protein|tara:strand:- start:283 stop:981 length:699 start_codon:yes stop_codon:yes gene_type:complete